MKTRTRYISKLEDLGALVNQLSEKTVLDVRAAGQALAGNGPQNGAGDDGVVDADYEEVK